MGAIEISSFLVLGLVACVIFLTCLFIHKWNKKKLDNIARGFCTSDLIHIKLSKYSQFLTKEKAEKWIKSIIKFWEDKKGWDNYLIKAAIKNTVVILTDREILQNGKKWTPALAYPLSKIIEIATLGVGNNPIKIERWTRHLFIHELSHIIVIYVGGMVDAEEQHELFNELNLRSL